MECVFAVRDDEGKLKVKATWAKMARGEMVRYMATNSCRTIEDLKDLQEEDISIVMKNPMQEGLFYKGKRRYRGFTL